jgi:hypothetical protein
MADPTTVYYGPDGEPSAEAGCLAKEVTKEGGRRHFFAVTSTLGRKLFDAGDTPLAQLTRVAGGEPLFRLAVVPQGVFDNYLLFLRTKNQARLLQAQREYHLEG